MNFNLFGKDSPQDQPARCLLLLPPDDAIQPEALATIQALYSRSPAPLDSALKIAKAASSSKEFIEKWYVGYGHPSIGELAMVVFAVENVSMLAAKVIQQDPMYRGQEASTRYLDFSKQPFRTRDSDTSSYTQGKMREFYINATRPTKEHVAAANGWGVEDKATKAATFDILRGFLPIGSVTSLSWAVDIATFNRRMREFLLWGNHIPEILEVRNNLVKVATEAGLVGFVDAVPNDRDKANFKELFVTWDMLNTDFGPKPITYVDEYCYTEFEPRGGPKPVRLTAELDFASWRDIARHRSVSVLFPKQLLNTNSFTSLPVNSWYAKQLPNDLQEDAYYALSRHTSIYEAPMAGKVPLLIQGDLHKLNYVLGRRSRNDVHPTLHTLMRKFYARYWSDKPWEKDEWRDAMVKRGDKADIRIND